MAVKIDATTTGILVHRYLAKVETTKYAEYYRIRNVGKRFERYQPIISHRKFYQIQWQNIWADVGAFFIRNFRAPWYAQVAFGVVSYDNATRGSVTPAAASLTFSHTTAAGSAAMIGGCNAVSGTTWTATYNSVSMTADTITDTRGGAFKLSNPTAGANNAVFTPGANRVIIGMVMTFIGANGTISDFTKDEGGGLSVTSTSITVPNFTSGDMIGEMLLIYADDPTASSAGANQTVRLAFSQQPPADPNATVTAASTNATNGTCTWSWTTARACCSFGYRINGIQSNVTLRPHKLRPWAFAPGHAR